MTKCTGENGCGEVPGFSFGEKAVIRVAFKLGIFLGAWGIWPTSQSIAIGYAAYAVISYTLLMRYTVCTRCPHLLVAGDCLFMPAPLVKLLVTDRKGPLSLAEHFILVLAIGGAAIPIYWLLNQPILLGAYAVVTGGWMAGLYLRICPRCQVEECPLKKHAQKK